MMRRMMTHRVFMTMTSRMVRIRRRMSNLRRAFPNVFYTLDCVRQDYKKANLGTKYNKPFGGVARQFRACRMSRSPHRSIFIRRAQIVEPFVRRLTLCDDFGSSVSRNRML